MRHKIDLHLHTIDDTQDKHVFHSAKELIDRAADLGYTVLAITLHDQQNDIENLKAYATTKSILLLPGVERTLEGKHTLLINFDRDLVERIKTFEDLRKLKKSHHLVIAPHPFYPHGSAVGDRFFLEKDVYDGLEISSYYMPFLNPNRLTYDVAKTFNLPLLGNSDTHTLRQLGTTWTELDAELSELAIIEGLKQGRGKVITKPLSLFRFIEITWKIVVRSYFFWIDYKKARPHALAYPAKYQRKK